MITVKQSFIISPTVLSNQVLFLNIFQSISTIKSFNVEGCFQDCPSDVECPEKCCAWV